jgi:hypothetical protein
MGKISDSGSGKKRLRRSDRNQQRQDVQAEKQRSPARCRGAG